MAIAPTYIASITTGTNASSYSTGIITPPENEVIYVACAGRLQDGSVTNIPTISGLGISWELVNSVIYDSDARLCLFKGWVKNPTSSVITINWNQTQRLCNAIIFSVLNNTFTDSVVQSAVVSSSITTQTVTLNAFQHPKNGAIGVFSTQSDSGVGFSAGSGFTELRENGYADDLNIMVEYKTANDTSIDATRSGGNNDTGGIGAEIRHPISFAQAIHVG